MHTVEGLISEQDKQDLARLAGASDRKGIVCEIGSLYGASAIAILQGLAGNGDFIFCYDLFEPEKLETFRRNLAGIGFSDKYLAIPGDFNLTFPHPSANRAIAFAFVDHDHSFENTASAYAKIWNLLLPGGVLVFHDYEHCDYPGGTRFLDTVANVLLKRDGMIAFQKPIQSA